MSASSTLLLGLKRCISAGKPLSGCYLSTDALRCHRTIWASLPAKRMHTTKSNLQQVSDARSYIGPSILAAGIAASLLFYHTATTSVNAEAPPITTPETKSTIRLADVKTHGEDSESKWVVKGTKVYDITDWISAHPGGDGELLHSFEVYRCRPGVVPVSR